MQSYVKSTLMPKRPRNDDYIPITERKRHPSLWFDDGNIILTTNASQFRVHRGLLSMNSPVFADMLSMPHPDKDSIENGFEGLAVVEISDYDVDFTHLLCFFYDHRYYQGGTETTFERISGLLRMSTKYQMDDLRNEIIDHLSLAYPTTLDKYLKAVDPKTQLPLFPPFHGQHFAVVNLARETDATILLPAALWRSTCMTPQDIVEGAVDSDGMRHILSPADIRECILQNSEAYKNIVQAEITLIRLLKRSECHRQLQTGCTEIAMSKVIYHFSRSPPDDRDDYDWITNLRAYEVWCPLVCDSCRTMADTQVSDWKTKWWEMLPSLFELPEWNS